MVTTNYGCHDKQFSSTAVLKSRQRIQVTTRSDNKPNKSCCDNRKLAETKIEGTSREIMSRHRFEVVTQKEDIVGRNRKLMLRPGRNAGRTYKVPTR